MGVGIAASMGLGLVIGITIPKTFNYSKLYNHLMLKKAILRTLAYSDVFDFPLKKEEIWRFLIISKKISRKSFENELKDLLEKRFILKQKTFYFLKNREKIISSRINKEKESSLKIGKAKKIAFFLSFIPTIKLIGVSGSLAMENTKEKDDIDFFIVTKKGTIWITRLLALLVLSILGKRRKRNDKNIKNKICLNLLIDEEFLELEKKDLYTAHEIVQMVPVFVRENTYDKFVKANLWVGKYLQNSINRRTKQNHTPAPFGAGQAQNKAEKKFSVVSCLVLFFSALEYPAKISQLWYMKKHRTTEIISDKILAFHPKDVRSFILREYEKRLKKYKI